MIVFEYFLLFPLVGMSELQIPGIHSEEENPSNK